MIKSSSHGFSASSRESLLAEESGHSVMWRMSTLGVSYRNLDSNSSAQQEEAEHLDSVLYGVSARAPPFTMHCPL